MAHCGHFASRIDCCCCKTSVSVLMDWNTALVSLLRSTPEVFEVVERAGVGYSKSPKTGELTLFQKTLSRCLLAAKGGI